MDKFNTRKAKLIADAMIDELHRATRKFDKFYTGHEGWAVIKEELDELWDELRKKQTERSSATLLHEATHVGAMAMRFIYDLLETS